MKKVISLLLIAMFFSLVSGCGDSGNMLKAPELDEAEVEELDLPFAEPATSPDDDANDDVAENDDNGNRERPGIQNVNKKTSGTTETTTSFMKCPASQLPDGESGLAYEHTIEVIGGTGAKEFEISSGSLPEGLVLSADGIISGVPTQGTQKQLNISVSDDDGGTRTCSLTIKVAGELDLEINSLQAISDWDNVYEIKAVGATEGLEWKWIGDTSNICLSKNKPDITTDDYKSKCTDPSQLTQGTAMYIWLKTNIEGNAPAKLTVEVDSPYVSEPTTYELELTYTYCGNGIKEGAEECDDGNTLSGDKCDSTCIVEVAPSAAQSIEITLWTGEHDGGGTNCDVGIRFCANSSMTNCTEVQELDDTEDESGDGDREKGDENIYDEEDGLNTSGITSEHKYFEISMNGNCGDDPGWLMQGIKVKIDYGTEMLAYTYYNPCALKWADDGDTIKFGPNDAAVCAIIETGDIQNGGTDNTVWLKLGDHDSSLGFVKTSISDDDGPFFSKLEMDGKLAMDMSWSNYKDFEQSDKTSYGDFIFDSNPFGDGPTVLIEKESCNTKGGWFLQSYEIFVFEPGKFLNDEHSKVFYAQDTPAAWLTDDEGLTWKATATSTEDTTINESIGGYL